MSQLAHPFPAVTPQERTKRVDYLDYIVATQRLEDIDLDPVLIALLQRLIDGEISMEDFARERHLPVSA